MTIKAVALVGLLSVFSGLDVFGADAVELSSPRIPLLRKVCRYTLIGAEGLFGPLPEFEPLSPKTPYILLGFYSSDRWPFTWVHKVDRWMNPTASRGTLLTLPNFLERFLMRMKDQLSRKTENMDVAIFVESPKWKMFYPPAKTEELHGKPIKTFPDYNPVIVAHQLGEAIDVSSIKNVDDPVAIFNLLGFDRESRANPSDPHFFDFTNFEVDIATEGKRFEKVRWFLGHRELSHEQLLYYWGEGNTPENRVLSHFDANFDFSEAKLELSLNRFLPKAATEIEHTYEAALLQRSPDIAWKDLPRSYQDKIVKHITVQMLGERANDAFLADAKALVSAWPETMTAQRMVAALVLECHRYRTRFVG